MSGEIEVDESYFLLRYTHNCVVEGARIVRGKRGRRADRKSFYFVLHTRPFARRDAKALG
ncbi:hypothetical protein [Campylobacter troglodytis]|uniref:hypothetical protein n=1 Tax=Campylobacter troglodytis TaxID=654363 RepID=UPI001FE289DF|nr:hypothetical protein [Campylobacter troglodytis]